MKKLFVIAIAAACAIGASAQRASDSASFTLWDSEAVDQKVVLGVRGGLNIATFSGYENIDGDGALDSKVGFRFGVSVDLPIVNSFYINSGLFYSVKGAKAEENDGEDYYKQNLSAGYLELPIYASYRLNFESESQLQINFGPYFAYGVNGKYKEEERYDSDTYKDKYDLFGTDEDQAGFKRFDCGLGIGMGYTFHKFYLGFDYQFGLTNILDKKVWEGEKAKTRNFNISIGYNF